MVLCKIPENYVIAKGMNMKKLSLILGLCALLALSTTAFATNLCTTVACVSPNDHIGWSSFGPPSTVWSTAQHWTSIYNSGAIGVAGPPTNFTSMQQSVSWDGNFSPGDWLIWNQDAGNFTGNAGTILVVFDKAVSAGGAQIQADFFGPFIATVCDQANNCFSEAGNSNSNGDGSAIFIGIANDPRIIGLRFSVVDINGNNNEAIDTAFFHDRVTPEPGTLVMLGTGLLGAIGYGRRRLGL
jgi:hypothetical protein